MGWKWWMALGLLVLTLGACAGEEPARPEAIRPIGGPPLYAQIASQRPTNPPPLAPTAAPWPTGASATLPPKPSATPGSTLTPPVVTPIAALPRQGQWLFVCGEARALCLTQANGMARRQITTQGDYLTPHWSPDGRRFVALRHTAMDKPDRISGEIVLFDADGTPRATFAPDPTTRYATTDLVWSPDGRGLAVTLAWDANHNNLADADERHEIYVLSGAALQLRQTVKLPGSPAAGAPVWSSDSRYLALSVWRTPPVHVPALEVSVYDTQTGEWRSVVEGTDPAWRPATTELTYVTGQGEIHSLNLAHGADRPLVSHAALTAWLAHDDPWLPEAALAAFWPMWSPDGHWLAFRVQGRSGQPAKPYPSMVFTVAASGEGLQRWPDTDLVNTARHVWSPDSQTLVYPYWLNGNGRYYPNPDQPAPSRRFNYAMASGVIVADVLQGSWWEAIGIVPAVDFQTFASFSPDSAWLLLRAPYREEGTQVVRLNRPTDRWVLPHVGPDGVQWQPGQ